MNFSCLYFYPRHLRHNLGRQACSSHFEEFQIGQSPIFRGCQFLWHFHLASYANFLTFLEWEDPVRAILGIIKFFYLNSNMSLIISHSGGSRLGHRASGTWSKPINLNENGQKTPFSVTQKPFKILSKPATEPKCVRKRIPTNHFLGNEFLVA